MEFTYDGTGEIPENTVILRCAYNVNILPPLSASLQTLYCGNTQITSLPALPEGLQILNCSSTQLTSLPVLPEGLQTLSCSFTQITSLPYLHASLQILCCNATQITSLPALPEGLQTLNCEDSILPEEARNSNNKIIAIKQWHIKQEKEKELDIMRKEIEQLRNEFKELKEQLKLVPGGELYLEAKAHYEEHHQRQLG